MIDAFASPSHAEYFINLTHAEVIHYKNLIISIRSITHLRWTVANLEAHYGTSDSGYYSDPYAMQGEPHHEQKRFQALSPVSDAEKTRAPALILQGEDGERCARGQAEELFTRFMTTSETPAELVLYPGGDHHFFENGNLPIP